MKHYWVFITLIIISTSGNSQSLKTTKMETIYLWPHEVPSETKAKYDAVQTHDTSNNVTRLTDVTNPILEVFKPDPAKSNGASIIICPGGGYQILAIDLEGYEIAKWLNKLGYTAFVLQYRVPNNQLGALNDVQRAIRIVRSKASEYQINTEKIGVLGFSAGGSLSARASTNYHKSSYIQIDEVDKFSCRPNFTLLIYPAYLDKGENRTLTPELTINESTPPMFIFATADDPYANSALVMAGALRDNKVPIELHVLPKGGHGYGLRSGTVAGKTWPLLAKKWLENIIK